MSYSGNGMLSSHVSRRRALAAIAALAHATSVKSAWAKQTLPICRSVFTVHGWKVAVSDIDYRVEKKVRFDQRPYSTPQTYTIIISEGGWRIVRSIEFPVIRYLELSIASRTIGTLKHGFTNYPLAKSAIKAIKAAKVTDDASLLLTHANGDQVRVRFPLAGLAKAIGAAETKMADLQKQEEANECETMYIDPGCFITTAACGAVGLADSCWELRTLRWFRDRQLASLPGGLVEIENYYRIAPKIVATIAHQPDAVIIFLRLYWSLVVPCAILARLGLFNLCHRYYRSRVQGLTEAYLPAGVELQPSNNHDQ